MKSPSHLRPSHASLNLTPMIDVVFLLIIFFLVSSTLIQQETLLGMILPSAHTGKLEEPTGREEEINIPEAGKILLRNDPITIEGLREYFKTKQMQGAKDIKVVIRANRDVPFPSIEPILLECVKSGVWNVNYAVIRE
ncbi:MAG: ExbD/TolR family protein [Thermoguttaceae bacterium]